MNPLPLPSIPLSQSLHKFRATLSSALRRGLLFVLASAPCLAAVHILNLEPTVLFPWAEPLSQIARLTVTNDSETTLTDEAIAVVVDTGECRRVEVDLVPGQSTINVAIQDLARKAAVRIELRRDGTTVASHEQIPSPSEALQRNFLSVK